MRRLNRAIAIGVAIYFAHWLAVRYEVIPIFSEQCPPGNCDEFWADSAHWPVDPVPDPISAVPQAEAP